METVLAYLVEAEEAFERARRSIESISPLIPRIERVHEAVRHWSWILYVNLSTIRYKLFRVEGSLNFHDFHGRGKHKNPNSIIHEECRKMWMEIEPELVKLPKESKELEDLIKMISEFPHNVVSPA